MKRLLSIGALCAVALAGMSASAMTIGVRTMAYARAAVRQASLEPVQTVGTVTFDPNGGTVSPSTRSVASGATVGELPEPTRTGYVFEGWWTAASGGTRISASTTVPGDVTYYAHWTPMYTVTLDSQGGSGGDSSVKVAYGYAMPAITVPKRDGYVFGGYFSGKDGVNPQYYDASGKSVTAWNRKWGSTIYAKWTPVQYTVTLDAQGGSGGTASVKVQYGSAMPAVTVPKRDGYTFGGYFSGKDGVNPQYYDANGKSVTAWNRKWGSTIYAKWTPVLYTVTLDAQGGSGGTTSVKAQYGSTMPAVSVPVKAGYVFGGYFSGKDGVNPQFYDASGNCMTAWNRNWGSTIYAKWIPAPYTVTLDAQGGSGGTASVKVAYDYAMPSITVPTKSGYVFGGYFSGKDGVNPQYYDANGKCVTAWNRKWGSTIYAKWIPAPYAVTLDAQGGSGGAASVKVAYGYAMPDITVPVKAGYVFGGYFSGKDGVNPQYYDANGKCVTAWNRKWGSTIYAKWISAPYTVTLDAQGGSGGTSSVKVAYDYAMPAITVPTKSGYAFGGYFSGKDGVAPQYYDAGGKCVTAWNRKWGSTIYAKWIRVQSASDIGRHGTAVGASAVVPEWAVGTFLNGEEPLAAITVSRDGTVSGTVLFADGMWTMEGSVKGRTVEAVAVDLDGNVEPVLLFIVQTADGRCRIESADGSIWAER